MTRIIFVDLDGTIREPITGEFVDSPHNQRVILGADKALKYFSNQGWNIIGISNQGGIEYGYKSLESTIEEMQYAIQLFKGLDCIYFCPDMAGNDCIYTDGYWIEKYSFNQKENYIYCGEKPNNSSFRKPGEQMLELAIFKSLAIEWKHYEHRQVFFDDCDCWMIGDRPEDEKAAENMQINFLAAEVFRNRFLPGMHEVKLSPQAIELLEGIKLS